MIVEFSIVPFTGKESLSTHIAHIQRIVRKSGLSFRLTPMGTIIEGEPRAVFDLIYTCHMAMKEQANRVLTQISIDDRGDDLNRMDKKILAVQEKVND
ncbi:MAG: MTH1187 family thiamine-binding protein [Acidobacteria bacterium]|nr:MTH1187 family thiamine-binding protein [Acidobacteriota bacterium]